MAVKVGINGFGRIGRQVLKAIRDYYPETLEVVAFNDIGDIKTMVQSPRWTCRNEGEVVALKVVADHPRLRGHRKCADETEILGRNALSTHRTSDVVDPNRLLGNGGGGKRGSKKGSTSLPVRAIQHHRRR